MADDGSVVIRTRMDVSQAEKDLAKLKKRIERTEDELSNAQEKRDKASEDQTKTGESLKEAQDKLKTLREELSNLQESKIAGDNLEKAKENAAKIGETISKLKNSLENAKNLSISQGAELDNEKRKLAGMSTSGRYTKEEISEQKKRVALLQAEWNKTEKEVDTYTKKINGASAALANQLQEIDHMEAGGAVSIDSASVEAAKASVSEQKQRVNELQSEWNKTKNAVERYDAKIADSTQKLEKQKEEAAKLEERIEAANTPAKELGRAFSDAGTSLEKFGDRIIKLAKRVFVFSMITMALRSLRTWLGNVIKTNKEASAAMARLKAALLTLAQPLVDVIIPAFISFVNILTKAVTALANVMSKLFGTTLSKSAEAAKNLYDEQQAINDVAEAAEDATGSLAGFDEINTIQTEAPSSSSGTNGTNGSSAPDFGGIGDKLDAITEAFTGAALIALGVILTFTGANILLGIGLIAVGAALIYDAVTSNPEAIVQMLQGPIGKVLAIVSAALLVLGVILVFSGVGVGVGLGIGLILLGAAGLTATVAANWNYIVEALRGPIGTITAIVSGALLILGIILVCTGVGVPIGIGLIIAGVAGFDAVVAVNWNYLPEKFSEIWKTITNWWNTSVLPKLKAVVSFFQNIWVGITNVFSNTKQWFSQRFNDAVSGIKNAFSTVKSFFSNIWSGITSIFGNVANWFRDKFSDAWQAVKNVFSTGGKIFDGIKDGILSGLKSVMNAIISGINKVIAVPFNGLNSALQKLKDVNIVGIKPFSFLSTISVPQIPLLAQGAVIPPNREFMAILGDQKHGTNIEAPEDLIRKIVREESGANNERIITLLQAILEATKAGRTAYVNKRVLAETVAEGLNDLTISGGKTALLL